VGDVLEQRSRFVDQDAGEIGATSEARHGVLERPHLLAFRRLRTQPVLVDVDPISGGITEYGPRDPRVDMSKVKRQLGNKLPEDPDEQNKAWYWLYKQVEKAPPVESVHRDFLLLRDYTALSMLFLLALGTVAGFAARPAAVLVGYLGFLVLQFVLVRLAAANCGKRFVTTVLAEQSVVIQSRKRASSP